MYRFQFEQEVDSRDTDPSKKLCVRKAGVRRKFQDILLVRKRKEDLEVPYSEG